jgi:hypothetical protein
MRAACRRTREVALRLRARTDQTHAHARDVVADSNRIANEVQGRTRSA